MVSKKTADNRVDLFPRALITDPGSRGFMVSWQGQSIQGFVVCRNHQLFAYVNSCPHTGAPLDWVDHQFLDIGQAHIQCAVHDARFEIESGRCVAGPCVDQYLKPLQVEVVGGKVVLRV